ncbi:F-box only protein 36a [Alosa sapidissima]|uniref:F-box only protein 36a n=1 Tax=Alosa sapidissima TaxID=34773 RepID=UPI001C08B656|nr:F-box only protein 36a [Alosa sapidissima]
MASLLGSTLFEITGQGPSPTKDFFQLLITKTEVIWRTWKISLRREFKGAEPGEMKQSHDDFLHDAGLQHLVGVVFGQHTLEHSKALCEGHYNYLERLPNQLLLRVFFYLSFRDIGRLAQTSQRFWKLSNSPELWEQTVRVRCDELTPDMEILAKAVGWRKIFFTFFHEKLWASKADPASDSLPSATNLA